MRLLFFDDWKLGVLKGAAVIDVSHTVRDTPHTGPHNLISGLIERFDDYRGLLEDAVKRGGYRSARSGSGLPCRSPATSSAWR